MDSPSPESVEDPYAVVEGGDSSPSSGDSSSLSSENSYRRIRFSPFLTPDSSPDHRGNRESVSPIPNAIETPPPPPPTTQANPPYLSPVLSSSAPQQNPNQIESEEEEEEEEEEPSSDVDVDVDVDVGLPSTARLQQSPNQIESDLDSFSPLQPKIPESSTPKQTPESEIDDFIAFFGHANPLDDEEDSEEDEEPDPLSPVDYPGYHPLSDQMITKMLDSPWYEDDPIEPVMCADPVDATTWDYFRSVPKSQRKLIFSSNTRPLIPGNLIYGIPVFELISISITRIDSIRGFSAISFSSRATHYKPLLIYKLPKEKHIILGQPLPLKGPFRPSSALDYISVALSNPFQNGWCFSYEPIYPEKLVYNKIHHEIISDGYSDSEAQISYELIESAAVAELSIVYDAHHNTPVTRMVVLSGTIYATNTDKPQTTKRLVQDFSSSTPLLNNVLPLNRPVFGVPTTHGLQVSMDLKCAEQGRPITVETSLTFRVPQKTRSDEQYVRLRLGELKVTVNWWKNMN